jgi:uncharacterized protein (DUF1800 family)
MKATQKATAAAIALNRFGLGARPGELDRLASPEAWLLRQLEGSPPVLRGDGLRSSAETLGRALERRKQEVEQRRARRAGTDTSPSPLLKLPAIYRPVYFDEVHARFTHTITTDRPFLERLTQFWTNHFAVSIDKVAVLGLAGALEREAIRPHVTRRFSDMLMAVEKHPAMILYLDNQSSIGPRSRAARLVARRGGGRKADINENLAREILELHTLGVDGGYTQEDVITFAKAITGWSIGGQDVGRRLQRLGQDGGRPGEFHFREALHEPGAKRLLGKSYDDDGLGQGERMLRDLAMRPETARHVCRKLARHFIADDPPASVIERMTRRWLENGGRLEPVYEAMIGSDEAWTTPLAKFKTPADFIHSTFRGLGLPVRDRRRSVQSFEALGQRAFSPGSPAGWPDTSADWDGPSALLKRIAWADMVAQRVDDALNARELAPQLLGASLTSDTATAIARAESGAQALTLLLASPEFMRR